LTSIGHGRIGGVLGVVIPATATAPITDIMMIIPMPTVIVPATVTIGLVVGGGVGRAIGQGTLRDSKG